MPKGANICKVMSTPEFVSAYREAYDERLAPVGAPSTRSRRAEKDSQVVRGAGAAGPAAIGPQVDAALDRALDLVKRRICLAQVTANAELPATVAESFSGAGAGLGVALASRVLGEMTGAFVSSIRPRGAACLCRPPTSAHSGPRADVPCSHRGARRGMHARSMRARSRRAARPGSHSITGSGGSECRRLRGRPSRSRGRAEPFAAAAAEGREFQPDRLQIGFLQADAFGRTGLSAAIQWRNALRGRWPEANGRRPSNSGTRRWGG